VEARKLIEQDAEQRISQVNIFYERMVTNNESLIDMEKDTTTNYENIISKVHMESLQEILTGYETRIEESIEICKEGEHFSPLVISISADN